MADGKQTNDVLRKQGWYLGELGEDAATAILRNSNRHNVFVVYKSPDHYILSVMFPPVEGAQEPLIDNFTIISNNDGTCEITGQSNIYDSIIDAVDAYTSSRDLSPALGNNDYQQQVSVSSTNAPPEYSQANAQLQPDIAPLPTIDNINPESPIEAETGHITGEITPSSSFYDHNFYNDNYVPPPDYMSNPHWWRYRDKNCCHPKNTWHCCWHRETYWHRHVETTAGRSWYNCKGTGFLRCLLLVLMWSCVWPCVAVMLLCYACYVSCGCFRRNRNRTRQLRTRHNIVIEPPSNRDQHMLQDLHNRDFDDVLLD